MVVTILTVDYMCANLARLYRIGEVMNFIYDKVAASNLTLEDVENDQFFVTREGWLAQKISANAYNIIANTEGAPWSGFSDTSDPTLVIGRVIPRVLKIEF